LLDCFATPAFATRHSHGKILKTSAPWFLFMNGKSNLVAHWLSRILRVSWMCCRYKGTHVFAAFEIPGSQFATTFTIYKQEPELAFWEFCRATYLQHIQLTFEILESQFATKFTVNKNQRADVLRILPRHISATHSTDFQDSRKSVRYGCASICDTFKGNFSKSQLFGYDRYIYGKFSIVIS